MGVVCYQVSIRRHEYYSTYRLDDGVASPGSTKDVCTAIHNTHIHIIGGVDVKRPDATRSSSSALQLAIPWV